MSRWLFKLYLQFTSWFCYAYCATLLVCFYLNNFYAVLTDVIYDFIEWFIVTIRLYNYTNTQKTSHVQYPIVVHHSLGASVLSSSVLRSNRCPYTSYIQFLLYKNGEVSFFRYVPFYHSVYPGNKVYQKETDLTLSNGKNQLMSGRNNEELLSRPKFGWDAKNVL